MLGVGINLLTLAIRKIAGALGFYPKTIDQSLRFNDNDSAYLSRTPSTAGNRKTWTWSGWVKRGNISTSDHHTLLRAGDTIIRIETSDTLKIYDTATSTNLQTSSVYRDSSAWYHIVVALDTTQSTSSNRTKIYVNGTQITAFSSTAYPTLNGDTEVNSTAEHRIGRAKTTLAEYLDGYLAEVHFCDGTAYTADDFGEFKSGVWVAKSPSVTYGTNGFYLKFANSGALGTDSSGNSNTWTPTNLAATDVMLDSPTNNFATWNSIAQLGSTNTFYEGNTRAAIYSGATPNRHTSYSTMKIPTTGKWYWETYHAYAGNGLAVGIKEEINTVRVSDPSSSSYSYYNADGNKYDEGTASAYGTAFYTSGQNYIVGVYFDADNLTLGFTLNGVDQGTAFTGMRAAEYYAAASDTSGSGGPIYLHCNFGQDSSFAGTKTPQGNTDANGIGDFYYAPPTGYLALCTANLPEPAISPLNDVSPTDYFAPVIYTGDGTTDGSHAISVGFQPDFTWIKRRSIAADHVLYDSVRPLGKLLSSNTTNAEGWMADGMLSSFDVDGFSVAVVGGNNSTNGTQTYVAWNWLAGGTPVSNTNGTITSSVSANTESGFSIVTYAGTSAVATVGHGLTQAPDMVIVKSRTLGTGNWCVFHKDLGGTKAVFLNLTNAAQTNANIWNNTAPTSSVIHLAGSDANNGNCVAYCFHSVEGFSKFGSYTGNGSSTDGPFVYLGFRPSFLLIKRIDGVIGWEMKDTARSPYNAGLQTLIADLPNAEGAGEVWDALSNGFKIRDNSAFHNASGGTYIYMAFAEMPFKYSTGR